MGWFRLVHRQPWQLSSCGRFARWVQFSKRCQHGGGQRSLRKGSENTVLIAVTVGRSQPHAHFH